MFKGTNQINQIYKGNTLISKVYKGDTLIYPSGVEPNVFEDATVAFSLMDLGLGATHVVKVRRSSDNVEQDFTANQIIQPASTSGSLLDFCGSGDGFVSVWYDQSSNQNNLINSTASNQARVVDNGNLVLENGEPALKFNLGNVMESINVYPTLQFQNHFYVASSTGSNNRVLDTRGTGSSGDVKGWQSKFSNSLDVTLYDDGNGNIYVFNNIVRNSQSLVTVLGSQTYLEEYTNGVLDKSTTGNIGDFNSGNKLYISGNANGQNIHLFEGTIQEMICFNIDKSAERTEIETNINNRYAIY